MPRTGLLLTSRRWKGQHLRTGHESKTVPMAKTTGQKISLNTATPKQLTQLPGIAKDTAYRLVNHRKRHGFFTHWEELAEIREFPAEKIDQIKQRATLKCPP